MKYILFLLRTIRRCGVFLLVFFCFLHAAQAKTTIAVLGDSLSSAYNMAESAGWVSLLDHELRQLDIEANVINASVSGATTAAGLQLLPAVLTQHQPDVLILELGGNDGLQGKPLVHIKHNLKRLITAAQAEDVDVLLVGIRIPPNYGSAYTEPFFNQYAELAADLKVAYLPFLLEGVATNDALMMRDGIHPKPAAQKRILNNVLPVLLPMLDRG